jgi:hypothetical protein
MPVTASTAAREPDRCNRTRADLVGDAAELACSAVKHAGELPPLFAALDAEVYRDHGPAYAVEWAERTAETLS